MRQQSKNPAEQLRHRAVTLAKKIVRQQANYECAYCGQGEKQGYQTHGSHIYPENTCRGMSADLDNILCLCATHHIGGFWKNSKEVSWHENPVEMADWFRAKYPELYLTLKERSRHMIQADRFYWEKKLVELKKTRIELSPSYALLSREKLG